MNGLIVVVGWIVGGTIGALVLWKALSVTWFEVGPQVRIDEDVAEQERLRKAAIDAAFKTTGRHIIRADFQKGNWK